MFELSGRGSHYLLLVACLFVLIEREKSKSPVQLYPYVDVDWRFTNKDGVAKQ